MSLIRTLGGIAAPAAVPPGAEYGDVFSDADGTRRPLKGRVSLGEAVTGDPGGWTWHTTDEGNFPLEWNDGYSFPPVYYTTQYGGIPSLGSGDNGSDYASAWAIIPYDLGPEHWVEIEVPISIGGSNFMWLVAGANITTTMDCVGGGLISSSFARVRVTLAGAPQGSPNISVSQPTPPYIMRLEYRAAGADVRYFLDSTQYGPYDLSGEGGTFGQYAGVGSSKNSTQWATLVRCGSL